MEKELDYDVDPELLDDENEGAGDEASYDGLAVDFIDYDEVQFEIPEEFEVDEND